MCSVMAKQPEKTQCLYLGLCLALGLSLSLSLALSLLSLLRGLRVARRNHIVGFLGRGARGGGGSRGVYKQVVRRRSIVVLSDISHTFALALGSAARGVDGDANSLLKLLKDAVEIVLAGLGVAAYGLADSVPVPLLGE